MWGLTQPSPKERALKGEMIKKYFFDKPPGYAYVILILLLGSFQACKKPGNAKSAFYYWKSSFKPDEQHKKILEQVANNNLYLHFFDVRWNEPNHQPLPDAVIDIWQPVNKLSVTPVVYINNQSFENIKDNAVDSLAVHCDTLINRIARDAKIHYQTVQFDCDWTLSTRDKYFNFLKAFKKLNKCRLEVTIRLHQIKYKERTGVPPVDRGVLMFYNMGTLNTDLQQASSIYNETDAAKYIAYIPGYPLQLDVALPLFSWAILIREGKIVELYTNIDKNDLVNNLDFELKKNAYQAKKSFFFRGVYIKENDIFKLEQTDVKTLQKAAEQLAGHLPLQQNRTIIYYELGNLDLSEFKAETLRQISADL